jgi:hypothetical protein
VAVEFERRARAEQQRVAQLATDRVPVLTAEAQTRLSWASEVRGFDELPVIYHPGMRTTFGEREFPYAVLTPTFAGHVRRAPEQLIFRLGDEIVVVERTGAGPRPTHYPIAGLHAVVMGDVLLDAWFGLRGVTASGTLSSCLLRFNAVGRELFAPFLALARPEPSRPETVDLGARAVQSAPLPAHDFKYHNLASRVVRPRDVVVAAISQPQVRVEVAPRLHLPFRRTAMLAHMVILTDTELILVEDSPSAPRRSAEGRHGSVQTYLSRATIERATVVLRDDGYLLVTFEQPLGDRVEVAFATDRRSDVERLLASLAAAAPGTPVSPWHLPAEQGR